MVRFIARSILLLPARKGPLDGCWDRPSPPGQRRPVKHDETRAGLTLLKYASGSIHGQGKSDLNSTIFNLQGDLRAVCAPSRPVPRRMVKSDCKLGRMCRFPVDSHSTVV